MLNTALIGLLIGAAIGGGMAWLLINAKYRVTLAEADRTRINESAGARSELAALRVERDNLMCRVNELAEQRAEAEQRARGAETEAVGANAALDAERTAALDRERLLARRDSELKEAFQVLSADALARNNESFVALAEGRIKEATAALTAKAEGDATARSQAINAMLDPMNVMLRRVEGQLHDVEKDRQSAYAGLREQVSAMHVSSQQLHEETRQLVNALRAPQVRGRWGELQLERIVELAGMVEHCDFDRAGGRRRQGRWRYGRTWWCTWPAASTSWWTPRCHSRRIWRLSSPATPTCTATGWPRTPGTCATTSTSWPPSPTGRCSSHARSSWCCSSPATRSWKPRCAPTRH